jgi:hypothetical protein
MVSFRNRRQLKRILALAEDAEMVEVEPVEGAEA